jgi:hypothetical protein
MRSISSRACSPGRIRERSRSRSSVRPRKACGGKGRRSSPPCPCSTFTSTALESTSTPHRETSSSARRTSFGNSSAAAEDRGARKDNLYELASPYEKYLNRKATNQLSYFDRFSQEGIADTYRRSESAELSATPPFCALCSCVAS